MKSKTSFFNPVVFRKDITRFWPLWALEIVYGMIFALTLMSGLSRQAQDHESRSEMLRFLAGGVATSCVSIVIMVFCGAVAVCVFSYLTKEREAYAVHSLPLRRETWFVSHYLAGIAMLIGAAAVIHFLYVIVALTYGLPDAVMLVFIYFLAWCVEIVFFYSLACVAVMLTGNSLMGTVVYYVLNCLAVGVGEMYSMLASIFVYGGDDWSDFAGLFNRTVVKLLTPAYYFWKYTSAGDMSEVMYQKSNHAAKSIDYGWAWNMLGYIAPYLLPAVILAVVAVVLYRKRPLEAVGDPVAFSWGRPVFRIVFVFCMTIIFANVMYSVVFQGNVGIYAYKTIYHIVLGLVIVGTILFYLVCNMILDRTFFIWKKTSYVRIGVFTVVMAAGVVAMHLGLFESELPALSQVQRMGVQLRLTDDDWMQEKTKLYFSDVSQMKELRKLNGTILQSGRNMNLEEDVDIAYIEMDYCLKNGSTVSKTYPVADGGKILQKVEQQMEAQAEEDAGKLLFGENYEMRTPAAMWVLDRLYGGDDEDDGDDGDNDEMYLSGSQGDEESKEPTWFSGTDALSVQKRETLYRAIVEDMKNGKYDVIHWKPQDSFYICVLLGSEETKTLTKQQAAAEKKAWDDEDDDPYIQVTSACTETLKALGDLGLAEQNDDGAWETTGGFVIE